MSTHAPVRDLMQNELIIDRARVVEWVRRRLTDAAPATAAELGRLLTAVGTSEAARRALTSPTTFRWCDTMVVLIDRHAPTLLPDGQFTACAAAVVNLTAGLDDDQEVTVRFDAHGNAELPVLGVVVTAPLRGAGRTVTVDIASPPPDVHVGPIEATPEAAIETVAEARPEPTRTSEAHSWLEASPILAAVLEPLGIPTRLDLNTLGDSRIRADPTFDHLSLLAVRQESDYRRVVAAVDEGTDRFADLLSAHCAYIGERYHDAAESYAALLIDEPNNADLWRDLCWALRHSGREEVTRVWVFHPEDVMRAAAETAFAVPREATEEATDNHSGTALDAVVDFLDGMARDIG